MQRITSPPASADGYVPEPSGFLYLVSDQLNLVNGVFTKILLNGIGAGYTDGIENVVTHRICPGIAGYYSISACVYFQNAVASKNYTAALVDGGGFLQISYSIVHSNSIVNNELTARLTVLKKMAVDSWVELWAKSESGDNNVDVKSGYSWMSVQRVR